MNDKKSTNGRNEPQIKHHQITLPKGGGAISGIGEKFQANAVTGTGTFSVPVPVTPSRSGFAPQLALTYDSGQGNSAFGLWWNVDIPAISRKTAKALPRYLDHGESDVFLLSGAEDLVPLAGAGGSRLAPETVTEGSIEYDVHLYRPRIEGLFARIEKWVATSGGTIGDLHWRATTRDNITSIYGKTALARIADPADDRRVFKWLLESTTDARGNRIVYEYAAEDLVNVPGDVCEQQRHAGKALFTNRYIKRIKYGEKKDTRDSFHFILVFDYGDHPAGTPVYHPTPAVDWPARPDPFSDYRAGFEVRTYRLCKRIVVFHDIAGLGSGPVPVRELTLTHEPDETATKLICIRQQGYKRTASGWQTKAC